MRVARLVRLACAACVLLVTTVAAADRARIALVVPLLRDPISLRLRAELEALGFEVVEELEPRTPPGRESLEATARAVSAVAAVRVASKGAIVEVWVTDRVTGKTVLTEVAAEGEGASRDATIALRAVELLRASFLEIAEPHPSRGEVEPTPEVRALAAPVAAAQPAPAQAPPAVPPVEKDAPRPARVRIEIGTAGLFSAGGLHAGPLVDLGATWMPTPHVGARVVALLPTLATSVDADEGGAKLRIGMLGAGMHLELDDVAGLVPGFDAGIAGAWLLIEGAGRPPLVSTTDSVFVAAPFAGAGLAYPLTPQLRIEGRAWCAVAAPRPVIEFAGREVATWGRPVAALSLALNANLP